MNIINTRGQLTRLSAGIRNGAVKIGFAGGSITTAVSPHNWPLYVRGWFVNRYKDVRLTVANAAIGATGSLCGLALAQAEFIDAGCEIVFIEYAVNDDGIHPDERMRTREGLIRKLLAADIDVVLVYTFYQEMYAAMESGETPRSIRDMELLAEHYNISSVFMAKEAYNQVENGMIPWNVWLPDGTHPQFIGSYFYASAVIAFLEQTLSATDSTEILRGDRMPAPLNPRHWQNTTEIPFDQTKPIGSWAVEREVHLPWFRERLFTFGLHNSLSFRFEGVGLAIIFSYGKSSALIEYRIDNGPWQTYSCERYWWIPEENFVNAVKFADDLAPGEHTFELRTTHENREGCTSANCSILKILAVR